MAYAITLDGTCPFLEIRNWNYGLFVEIVTEIEVLPDKCGFPTGVSLPGVKIIWSEHNEATIGSRRQLLP